MTSWDAARALGLAGAVFLCAATGVEARPSAAGTEQAVPAPATADAMLHDFNARLLAGPTATGAMEAWCRDHHLAAEPRIRALPDRKAHVDPDAGQRSLLQVGPDERIGYRRVALMCGDRTFSVAENWYVPGRLTPAMNALLGGGRTPFGPAIKSLDPSRRTLGVDFLWDGTRRVPEALLVHRALVLDGQGRPISLVVETYQRGLLP